MGEEKLAVQVVVLVAAQVVVIAVADTLTRIVGIYPGIIVKLILDVIGACIFIFAINRIKITARKR